MQGEEKQAEENRRLYVYNTFLEVRDERVFEAQKVQLRRSASDSSLGSKSRSGNSDEYPNPRPLVPDGQASGRASPILNVNSTADRGQMQRQSGPASHNDDDYPAHVVWNNDYLSSPSTSNYASDRLGRSDSKSSDPTSPKSQRVTDYTQAGFVTRLHQDCPPEASTSSAGGPDGRPPIWSAGSAGHEGSTCKPCVWYHQSAGCSNGQRCEFCHLCLKDSMRFKLNKGRYKAKAKKEAAAAAAAAEAVAGDPQAIQVALQPGLVPRSSTRAGPSQAVAAAAFSNAPAAAVVLNPGLLPAASSGTYPGPPQHVKNARSGNGYMPTKFSM